MAFAVYDYRTINKNLLVTPEIRARLYHMAPGQVDARHSHDLGHEVFLILEGKAEFNIAGHIEVLGTGQMCVARADEIHQVRNLLPDAPTIMYLSVTPHIQPTHTFLDGDDQPLPPVFRPNSAYDDPGDLDRSTLQVLAEYVDAVDALAQEADRAAHTQSELATAWRQAIERGNVAEAAQIRNSMSDGVYRLHKQLSALSSLWNELAPRGEDNRSQT